MSASTPLELCATEHRLPPRRMGAGRLTPLLVLIGALALIVPVLLLRFAYVPGPRVVQLLPPRRVIPAAELPPVEPMRFVDLAPEDARTFNAEVPFAKGPNPAAHPFTYAGSDIDRARATDCLAAAVIYEAGDDAIGEKAVAQVVLNRLRHPAFPKTVCGVVFEGSTRATGCQFTFTCDGSLLRRRPGADAWSRAQAVAAQALNGAVYRPVGHATHYHTDWVVPYWQSSLDKIAKIGTHLFFRWTGWWGTPGAFTRGLAGPEPEIAALAPVAGGIPGGLSLELGAVGAATGGEALKPIGPDADNFLVTLPAGLAPQLWPELAQRACGDRPHCRFVAWKDGTKTASTLPLSTEQIAAMSFSYLRDRPTGFERTLWNCQQTPRPDRRECMKLQVLVAPSEPLVAAPPPTAAAAPLRGPAELEGVRRRPTTPTPPGTAPAPAPSASPLRPRSDAAAIPSPAAAAPRRSGP